MPQKDSGVPGAAEDAGRGPSGARGPKRPAHLGIHPEQCSAGSRECFRAHPRPWDPAPLPQPYAARGAGVQTAVRRRRALSQRHAPRPPPAPEVRAPVLVARCGALAWPFPLRASVFRCPRSLQVSALGPTRSPAHRPTGWAGRQPGDRSAPLALPLPVPRPRERGRAGARSHLAAAGSEVGRAGPGDPAPCPAPGPPGQSERAAGRERADAPGAGPAGAEGRARGPAARGGRAEAAAAGPGTATQRAGAATGPAGLRSPLQPPPRARERGGRRRRATREGGGRGAAPRRASCQAAEGVADPRRDDAGGCGRRRRRRLPPRAAGRAALLARLPAPGARAGPGGRGRKWPGGRARPRRPGQAGGGARGCQRGPGRAGGRNGPGAVHGEARVGGVGVSRRLRDPRLKCAGFAFSASAARAPPCGVPTPQPTFLRSPAVLGITWGMGSESHLRDSSAPCLCCSHVLLSWVSCHRVPKVERASSAVAPPLSCPAGCVLLKRRHWSLDLPSSRPTFSVSCSLNSYGC